MNTTSFIQYTRKGVQLLLMLWCCVLSAAAQPKNVIVPGGIWPDNQGNHIQAHGGGIIKIGKTYYWYGEQRTRGLDTNYRYVSGYRSTDLIHWTFMGNVLQLADPEQLGRRWVLERPKVFYHKKSRTYVMYFHLDDRTYKFARVGVATSKKPQGPFTYVRSFRPLGYESRDIGQFIDDDGTPYLIFESRPSKGFYIAGLSADYLNVEREVSFIQAPLEGGAIVHYQGLYYAIGSALTGWRPNPNKFATAASLAGPWSEFKDIAPPHTNTYSSQSTMLLKIEGTKNTTVLYMGDQWKPATQWDSRYLWMPVEIGDGKLWLPEPKPFTLQIRTGEWKQADNVRKDSAAGLSQRKTFQHPGILHTQASLDHLYQVAQQKTLPEYGSYELLKNHPLASAQYKMNGPYSVISRDGEYKWTKSKMEADFSAAYLNALMWAATKEAAHARKSVEILEGYADSLTLIPATNDAPLLVGLEGTKIVNALEILRYTWKDFPVDKLGKLNKMLTGIFLPVCEKFYATPAYTNGNWGPIVTKLYLSAAIWFNNDTMYRKAIDFYYNARDNGTIRNYIGGETGQIQESGRDQGHCQLGIGALATVCEIAWSQGDDLYGALGNRLLKGFEYVARYNLGQDVPFSIWTDITGKYSNWTHIAEEGRGRFMPVYEMVYNHYVKRKGLAMPYTEQVIQRIRPEGYDRDQPAFGTLLFYGTK